MNKSTKRKVAAGAAAAVAIAGGGAAIGATQLGSPQQESQAVVNDAAKQLGIDPTKLSDALKTALEHRVDAAVAAGTITKDQGDRLKAQIDSGAFPLFTPGLQHRFGFGFGGPGFGGPGMFRGAGDELAAAADYLGLTPAQLRTELESGKSLADVAKAQNKSVDGLVQALYDARKKDLDAAVKAGKLTQAQEDAILADLKSRLTDRVNGTAPPHFGHGFMHFGGDLTAAAAYLGLTEAQLLTQLQSGKSLADVAKAQNKSVDGLVQALYDVQKKQLDAAVKAGKLTQSQADAILADLESHLTDLVNGTMPRFDRDGGPPGFGFRRFRNFDGGPPPAAGFRTA
jgi:polyhydroxyalkanoate synthesis regulator phasin